MATTPNPTKSRILTGLVAAIVLNVLFVAVYKCRNYKATAKTYQDSTAYYKVQAAQRCQTRLDSLQHLVERLNAEQKQKTNDLNAATPSWLR